MFDRVNLTDQVYAHIRDAIVDGELAPGSQQSVYRLAERLGVSRTPVREAIIRLADLGMVEIERNLGVRIKGVTAADIRDIYELRLLIEVPAAEFAASHGSDGFLAAVQRTADSMRVAADAGDEVSFRDHDLDLHNLIAGSLENQRLSDSLRNLRDATRARGAWTGNRTRDLEAVISEHMPIVECLVARDAAGAGAAMRSHLVTTADLLMAQAASLTGESLNVDWAGRLER